MGNNNKDATISDLQQERMLKLIAKSFYKELVNYGIDIKEIITLSSYLIDNMMNKDRNINKSSEYYSQHFKLNSIKDEWNNHKRLVIEDVGISPLQPEMYPQVALWLRNPEIKYSFISMFPDSESALKQYFEQPNRNYFGIFYNSEPVGVIGADNIDNSSRKLEMKKFIGDNNLRGKGIGKRATFLFLYYAFVILKFNKVYIHSGNTNIRNINLNSKFGFELEGIFFDDVFLINKMQDVVRMGLLRSQWIEIFSNH
jgi:RimJ/RimL family protein N-acetyltransferase